MASRQFGYAPPVHGSVRAFSAPSAAAPAKRQQVSQGVAAGAGGGAALLPPHLQAMLEAWGDQVTAAVDSALQVERVAFDEALADIRQQTQSLRYSDDIRMLREVPRVVEAALLCKSFADVGASYDPSVRFDDVVAGTGGISVPLSAAHVANLCAFGVVPAELHALRHGAEDDVVRVDVADYVASYTVDDMLRVAKRALAADARIAWHALAVLHALREQRVLPPPAHDHASSFLEAPPALCLRADFALTSDELAAWEAEVQRHAAAVR